MPDKDPKQVLYIVKRPAHYRDESDDVIGVFTKESIAENACELDAPREIVVTTRKRYIQDVCRIDSDAYNKTWWIDRLARLYSRSRKGVIGDLNMIIHELYFNPRKFNYQMWVHSMNKEYDEKHSNKERAA